MFQLHTEWTVDWAVRMVKPIEDWLNYRCPIVPRRWLDTERRLRWNAEYDIVRQRDIYERDISLLADAIEAPVFAVQSIAHTDDATLVKDLEITIKPYRRFYRLNDSLGVAVLEMSEDGIGFIASNMARRATEHVRKNLVDELARIQAEDAA